MGPSVTSTSEWKCLCNSWDVRAMALSHNGDFKKACQKGYDIHCGGGGTAGNCQIGDTGCGSGVMSEWMPCKDYVFTCSNCGRQFCGYHSWVNNSDDWGSFGGHVCQ